MTTDPHLAALKQQLTKACREQAEALEREGIRLQSDVVIKGAQTIYGLTAMIEKWDIAIGHAD